MLFLTGGVESKLGRNVLAHEVVVGADAMLTIVLRKWNVLSYFNGGHEGGLDAAGPQVVVVRVQVVVAIDGPHVAAARTQQMLLIFEGLLVALRLLRQSYAEV